MIISDTASNTDAEGQTANSIPAVAGGVVAGLAVLILVAIIIIVVVFLKR